MGELKHALLCACRQRQDDPQQFIVAPYPGYLLCQDTYCVGEVRGLGHWRGPGELYLQTVVDAHCSLAFARLYLAVSATAAAEILRERVLPFYAQQGLRVERLLTDNAKEFGRRADHLYETTLRLAGIEHVRCDSLPAAADNPFCTQFHRILEEEFFAPTLRKDFHLHFDTLQNELDTFLKWYNCARKCPGIRTQGRPPYRAFLDAREARGIGEKQADRIREEHLVGAATK
jgi:hypothetical protein